jgi:hypothetical protein
MKEYLLMHSTRTKIKHPFIAKLGINPRDYDMRRGDIQPYERQYVYDEFDKIIIKTAAELFKINLDKTKEGKNKIRYGVKLDVFWFLYACKDYEETAECVLKENNDKKHPIKIATVKRYERDIINKILHHFNNNKEIRNKIYEAIKAEYGEIYNKT